MISFGLSLRAVAANSKNIRTILQSGLSLGFFSNSCFDSTKITIRTAEVLICAQNILHSVRKAIVRCSEISI